jgi:hypothetical protein
MLRNAQKMFNSVNKAFVLILLLNTLFALWLNRTPLMMTSSAPDGTKPWADGPCDLIATPAYTTNKVRNRNNSLELAGNCHSRSARARRSCI